MIKTLKQIHRIWFFFLILFFFLLFLPVYYFSSRNPKYYGILNWFRKANSLLPTALSGIFFSYNIEQETERKQTYIYCANHTSNLDIMILCLLAHDKYHFMGKEELLNNWVLRLFFTTIDITVNRSSKISAFKAFKKAGENLEKGMSLIIFPEGRINDTYPPVLGEFKNGPFRLAIDKKIPIVPVSITNIWKLMWDEGGEYGTRPGVCNIYVHKPIETSGFTADDSDKLKEQVFDLIESKLYTNELRRSYHL